MMGVAAEYEALRRHAVVVDRSARGRVRFSGAKAADTLNGLITNDVAALGAGGGVYAAALTPKGKVAADLRVFVFDDSILTDCPIAAWEGWWGIVRKFVNPRLSGYRDERETVHAVGVFGPEGPAAVAALTHVPEHELMALAPYHHRSVVLDDVPITVARVPDFGVDGFEIFAVPDVARQLRGTLIERGLTLASDDACEIARIEAGRPAWGVDMDDNTIPQEANFDELDGISYTKGCYTGQEVVARVHFRGHVNKHLRGLRSESAEPPPRAAVLTDADGKPVGDVRSAASSPRLGGIALAMVRREIEAGSELTAQWSGGTQQVRLAALPFPG
jgi:folate-binding protein YgfZ